MARAGWKNWRGPEVKKIVNDGTRRAVLMTGEIVLAAGKQEAPHREGTLERSGTVKMAPGRKPEGCVSFGGGKGTGHPKVPYARRWHENSANFQKGRKRFYLRDPFNRLAKITLERLTKQEVGGDLRR